MKKILFLIISIATTLSANYTVSPMSLVLDPSESGSQQWITVKHEGNDTGKPLAIEISVFERDQDIHGKTFHENQEHNENFGIYPNQIILYPGEVQMVYIQWHADYIPEIEGLYTISSKQLPIELKSSESQTEKAAASLNILINYEGLLQLRTEDMKAKLEIDSIEKVEGKNQMRILLNNKGNANQTMHNAKFKIKSIESGNHIILDPKTIDNNMLNRVFPGKTREIILEWPQEIEIGPVEGSLIFE